MKQFSILLLGALLAVGAAPGLHAQSLVSGFMAGKGHGSVVVSGTAEQYSSAYLAPEKVSEVPVYREVHVKSINLYGTYGLTDKIDAIVSLPYIQSKGQAFGATINDLNTLYPEQGTPAKSAAAVSTCWAW
jgi:hypothetical protein